MGTFLSIYLVRRGLLVKRVGRRVGRDRGGRIRRPARGIGQVEGGSHGGGGFGGRQVVGGGVARAGASRGTMVERERRDCGPPSRLAALGDSSVSQAGRDTRPVLSSPSDVIAIGSFALNNLKRRKSG